MNSMQFKYINSLLYFSIRLGCVNEKVRGELIMEVRSKDDQSVMMHQGGRVGSGSRQGPTLHDSLLAQACTEFVLYASG